MNSVVRLRPDSRQQSDLDSQGSKGGCRVPMPSPFSSIPMTQQRSDVEASQKDGPSGLRGNKKDGVDWPITLEPRR